MVDGVKIIGLIINISKNIMTTIIKTSLEIIVIIIDIIEVQAM